MGSPSSVGPQVARVSSLCTVGGQAARRGLERFWHELGGRAPGRRPELRAHRRLCLAEPRARQDGGGAKRRESQGRQGSPHPSISVTARGQCQLRREMGRDRHDCDAEAHALGSGSAYVLPRRYPLPPGRRPDRLECARREAAQPGRIHQEAELNVSVIGAGVGAPATHATKPTASDPRRSSSR